MDRTFARTGQAFTLIETMVALGLIATVLLFVVGLFTSLLRPSQKSLDVVSAELLAGEILAEEVEAVLTGAGPVPVDTFFGSYSVPMTGTRHVNGTTFDWVIDHHLVTSTSGDPIGDPASVEVERRVKKFDITVSWGGTDPGELKDGYGKLSVGATALALYRPGS